MPKTITKTVYTYLELLEQREQGNATAAAIDKAREWLAEGQTCHDWWDYVYETWTSALEQIGFYNVDINFSGFWSQGDGASFTANVDIEKLVAFFAADIKPVNCIDVKPGTDGKEEDFLPWVVHKLEGKHTGDYRRLAKLVENCHIDARVHRTSHHYSHENTCDFKVELHDGGRGQQLHKLHGKTAVFELEGEHLREKLCKAIYADLEAEHEYLTGDEAISEFAEANEYTFTIDGKREG